MERQRGFACAAGEGVLGPIVPRSFWREQLARWRRRGRWPTPKLNIVAQVLVRERIPEQTHALAEFFGNDARVEHRRNASGRTLLRNQYMDDARGQLRETASGRRQLRYQYLDDAREQLRNTASERRQLRYQCLDYKSSPVEWFPRVCMGATAHHCVRGS